MVTTSYTQSAGMGSAVTIGGPVGYDSARNAANANSGAALGLGRVFWMDGLSYVNETGGTACSDLSVSNVAPYGDVTPQHFGAVGDGSTDDGAKIALMYGMAQGKTVNIGSQTYVINALTIDVLHPTKTIGTGDFVFTGMGGFTGLDGFNIVVADDVEYNGETGFDGVGILTSGAFGRDGVKTPTNQGGDGLLFYKTVRPRFTFKNMRVGSLERTPSVSSNTLGVWGWNAGLHVGESAMSAFSGINFIQPFTPATDVATWAGKDECCAVHLDAGVATATNGPGPIYQPEFDNISGFGCGIAIKTTGFISVPRMSNMDFTLGGYGIKSTGAFTGATGRDCISELTISDCNFNVAFGGIEMEATDWIDQTNVRNSVAAVTDLATAWCGFKITAGFSQVNIDGYRTAQFGATGAARTYTMLDLNGRVPATTGQPGMLYLSSSNILSGLPSAVWDEPIKLRNVREAFIAPPQLRLSSGPVQALLYVESDHTSVPPRYNLTGSVPAGYTNIATFGTGGAASHLFLNSPRLEGTSTALGYFVKDPQGWMTLTMTVNSFASPNVAAGNIFASAETAFSFPTGCVFIAAPNVNVSVRSSTTIWANGRPTSTTAGAATVFSAVSVGSAVIVDIVVTGRWK